MRIKATTAFTDKQAKVPEEAHVPEGKEFTVTAARGAELIGFGLAVEVDGPSASSSKTRKARKTEEPVPAPITAPVITTDPLAPPALEHDTQ